MKSGSIFWGVLLITLGGFFLLYNFSVDFNISAILDLWPLVLVVWGVSLLKISPTFKNILSGISGGLLGLIIVALITSSWCCGVDKFDWGNSFFSDDTLEFHSEADSVTVEYDSACTRAALNFSGGAGEFKIKGGADNLADFYTLGDFASVSSKYSEDKTSAEIEVAIHSADVKLNNLNSRSGDIKLSAQPVWDISLKIGAAEFAGDLSGLKIKKLTMSAGAADISLKLGALLDSSNYVIETGVASVDILVPNSAGCEIKTLAGLSAKDFKGFDKKEKRTWRTGNFYSAKKKIFLMLKGGMSKFDVERY